MNRSSIALGALLYFACLPPAAADPAFYLGYTGKKWPKDYGIIAGTCDPAAIGKTLAGQREGSVAMMSGARIGPKLDEGDRGCWGHALELAVVKRTVAWTNKATGISYRLIPTRDFQQTQRPCREFTTHIIADGRQHMIRAVACRRGEGEWELRT
jgi:surface antigen